MVGRWLLTSATGLRSGLSSHTPRGKITLPLDDVSEALKESRYGPNSRCVRGRRCALLRDITPYRMRKHQQLWHRSRSEFNSEHTVQHQYTVQLFQLDHIDLLEFDHVDVFELDNLDLLKPNYIYLLDLDAKWIVWGRRSRLIHPRRRWTVLLDPRLYRQLSKRQWLCRPVR